MSWSYSPANNQPITTSRDRVRFEIGDTDPNDPLLQDEEIAIYLAGGFAAQPTVLLAAAVASDAIAAKFRRLVDVSEGGASAALSQRAKAFTDQAAALRARAAREGGVATTAVLAANPDGSARGPAFTRTLGDYPGAGDWPPC